MMTNVGAAYRLTLLDVGLPSHHPLKALASRDKSPAHVLTSLCLMTWKFLQTLRQISCEKNFFSWLQKANQSSHQSKTVALYFLEHLKLPLPFTAHFENETIDPLFGLPDTQRVS
jgi:hypothetical protein